MSDRCKLQVASCISLWGARRPHPDSVGLPPRGRRKKLLLVSALRHGRIHFQEENALQSLQASGSSQRSGDLCGSNSNKTRGFTLIEISIVVLILSLLAAAGLRYATAIKDSNNNAALTDTLDTIETALMNYRMAYGRLPCPADITLAENTANFGNEIEALGDGLCTGANYFNAKPGSTTDPDGASAYAAGVTGSGNNSGAADTLYDSTSVNQVTAGALPSKALKLPDRYAYDPWGRKILYVVDKRMTATSAFSTYSVTSSVVGNPGAIVVKYTWNNTLANAITYKGIYALVSYGKNGHGGYVRNLSATPIRYLYGSNNTDEQKNCHCDSNAAATTFDRIFVQKARTGTTATLDTFDDVVRFKNRSEMATPSELQ